MVSKKNKKIRAAVIAVVALCVLASACVLIYPSVYEYQCKLRCFDELEKEITDDILESNIVIVKHEKKEAEGVTNFSWSAGASGVVFASRENTYYALTAYHVVKDFEQAEYIVIPYGAPSYAECRENSETYLSNTMYYERFGTAQVVFAKEEYDLAVIAFQSEKKLSVLPIAEGNPKQKEEIVVISNPEGERFACSYGTVRSEEYFVFESGDDLLPVNTLKHSAYVNHGSSGGAVLNQDMEVVGINIGGGSDFWNRVRYGAMVPCEVVKEFLESQEQK